MLLTSAWVWVRTELTREVFQDMRREALEEHATDGRLCGGVLPQDDSV
jgi:hypothetical protein